LAWLPALGPFAAAAAVFVLWVRDIKSDRDHCRTKLDERASGDAEIRDTFRQAVHTIEANTAAMSATREALTANREAIRSIETRMRALERRR
jgi:predicted  nucleic acid-binding Zn-ribbon protein